MAKAGPAVLLALTLTALLAVVGAASHGHPLSLSGHGGGPSQTFFDYVFTTMLLLFVVSVAIAIYAGTHGERSTFRRDRRSVWWSMLLFLAFVGAALLVAHFRHVTRTLQRLERRPTPSGAATSRPHTGTIRPGRGTHLRWDEIAVFAALAAAAAAYLLVRRGQAPRLVDVPDPWAARADVTALLDDTVDDLRNERDVRRAIVAAYARMELALAAHGLPRAQSEAPLEFLERALLRLRVSADSVRRLTDLFEWAKFSHHEPEARMKDEAIDALLAVRDELRAGDQVAA